MTFLNFPPLSNVETRIERSQKNSASLKASKINNFKRINELLKFVLKYRIRTVEGSTTARLKKGRSQVS
ncbi:hypothetical protein V1478_013156 [Vespula squamosa]|uniref:Uncharacterized protein n=1 Tax=Vespula squamosa TaxID=30214 RepID=A0ABD2AAL6_VESSQ